MLIVSFNKFEIDDVKQKFKFEFEKKNLGSAKKIIEDKNTHLPYLNQHDYVNKIIKNFDIFYCKRVT